MKFATSNKNKIREAEEITGEKFEALSIDLPEIQEIDTSKVIEAKAKEAYKIAGVSVLVEDTGLAIDAWGGLPGALIKWFMKTVGNEGIIKMLGREKNRKVTATTYLAYFDGEKTHTFTGSVEGTIPEEIKGRSGFGWDPIFVPNGSDKSYAEMSKEEKNNISMRAKAFKTMRASK